MLPVALALAAFCALPQSQCADFHLVADLLHATAEKATTIADHRLNGTLEDAELIRDLRKKLGREFHVLEQGLLSGNEGRMSALIARVKSSVDAVDTAPNAAADLALQTSTVVLQVLDEVGRMLRGNPPGWTPSWHYIYQFLEAIFRHLPS